jgi:transposase-like protein
MLSNSFKWKHYEGEIILLNVRWYLKYPLSYRNLKEMMIERGIQVDHSTIMGSVAKNLAFLQKSVKAFTIREVNPSHHPKNGT